jgi:xylan 1,4-beta-xylosidase
VVELKFKDGKITCDRDEPTRIQLQPPGEGGSASADVPSSFPVNIRVDASKTLGPLKPVWRFFGADEPNYAYLKNGRKLLGELGVLRPNGVFFRAHNLLTSGDGTPALKWGSSGAYREDEPGKPVYDWTILDCIFDTYRASGVRPYAQIGFMPEDLSVKLEPYQHKWTPAAKYDEIYTGWAYPPKDYAKWAELVYQWVRHCVERYGQAEVEQWYWEVWNEPNIGYWRGTREEFCKLHDYAIDAVRRALPTARVGGPDVAGSGGRFSEAFYEHCLWGTNFATGRVGTPLDFVSFHAKGAPVFTNGHVRMGIATHLRTVNDGFRIIAGFPELKTKPIVIGESDPEGCAACQGPQLGYRNSTMYSSYTAASFARIDELAERQGVNLEGVLTWAFTFEEQPLFAGFRQLATGGIDLPVLNVFRMFGQMGGRRLAVRSDAAVPLDEMMKAGVRTQPDVGALASRDGNRLCVLLWHYHDDDVAGPDAVVSLEVAGLSRASGNARLTHHRVDDEHSNAYAAWKRMESPLSPTAEALKLLEAAGRLAMCEQTRQIHFDAKPISLNVNLPRQAVSLLVLEFGAGSSSE